MSKCDSDAGDLFFALPCRRLRIFQTDGDDFVMMQRQTVLIVDDEAVNLKMLKAYLVAAGYDVLEALDGLQAIEMAKEQPDLVLLDVMMPDMDGFETCCKLKENQATRDIPVVFLSALHDVRTKVYGFELGGVDYVSKPFEAKELLARVRTHLTLRRQEIEIREYARKLEQMVEERTRQLIHADRLATLGTFSSAIIHEISNPSTYIGGNAELLKFFWSNAKPIVERHIEEDTTGMVAKLTPNINAIIDAIQEGNQRISTIVSRLRTYGRRESAQMRTCSLEEPVYDAINLLQHRLKRGNSVEVLVSPGLELYCDPQKLSQGFVNLINNAIDAVESVGQQAKITIEATNSKDGILIRTGDNGPGIAVDAEEQIFEPFFTTKSKETGTGLGLFIVKSIVEEHGGEVCIARSHDGGGAEFDIFLPSAAPMENKGADFRE